MQEADAPASLHGNIRIGGAADASYDRGIEARSQRFMRTAPQSHASHDDMIWRLVAFKWLMVGEGLHVDVPRLRKDEGYAQECLRCGLSSHSEAVRTESRGLRQMLVG